MNPTALLLLLGLMGTVCSNPVNRTCPDNCVETDTNHHQHFKHVSDLRSSSVAPWKIRNHSMEGRWPHRIYYAECEKCIMDDTWIAKPIYFQISVYQRARSSVPGTWCRCPYELAVGCTCVKKKQHQDNSQSLM